MYTPFLKKTSKQVKSGCFKKASAIGANIYFEIKEGYKVSGVKIIVWLIFNKEGTNTLIFYILEYGAKYDAECSAESDE